MRDFQRQKVYDWEKKYIFPHDRSFVSFEQIQSVVDYVWFNEGLSYPPKVIPLASNTKNFCGKANRLEVQFFEKTTTKTCVILHELAHSMTHEHVDDQEVNDGHGVKFMGIFMRLLDKYMQFELSYLRQTAEAMRIRFNMNAKPFKVIEIK